MFFLLDKNDLQGSVQEAIDVFTEMMGYSPSIVVFSPDDYNKAVHLLPKRLDGIKQAYVEVGLESGRIRLYPIIARQPMMILCERTPV